MSRQWAPEGESGAGAQGARVGCSSHPDSSSLADSPVQELEMGSLEGCIWERKWL